jgi:hypothetical protein
MGQDFPPGTSDPSLNSDSTLKVTTHLNPVNRPRMVELFLHLPIRLHGVELNPLSISTALFYVNLP